MILPKKHLSINESYFGFGAFLLEKIDEPITIDVLWNKYKDAYSTKLYPIKFTFDQFILSVDYLYLIGAIKQNEEGMISYETN